MAKPLVATVSSKGQVTLPKRVRELLHLRMGDYVKFDPKAGGMWVSRVALEPEGFTEDEWRALGRLADRTGRRYKTAKGFLKDLERL
jgi:AbrB family looped-hinge helix DNA binding protein